MKRYVGGLFTFTTSSFKVIQAETINRLLKKQSRPKNKRATALNDRSPLPSVSGSRTPKTKLKSNPQEEGEEAEVEEEEDEDIIEEPPKEVKPVMYRWVSALQEVLPSIGIDHRRPSSGNEDHLFRT